jgi:excisionase family DNA binding protein
MEPSRDNDAARVLPELKTIPEVAEAFDISLSTVKRAIGRGELVVHRFGNRCTRIAVEDARRWLATRRNVASTRPKHRARWR